MKHTGCGGGIQVWLPGGENAPSAVVPQLLPILLP